MAVVDETINSPVNINSADQTAQSSADNASWPADVDPQAIAKEAIAAFTAAVEAENPEAALDILMNPEK